MVTCYSEKSMIHECEIKKEPAELLVGRTRPVDGEADADSIRFKFCDYCFNDSDKYISLITDCRLRLMKRLHT